MYIMQKNLKQKKRNLSKEKISDSDEMNEKEKRKYVLSVYDQYILYIYIYISVTLLLVKASS